MKNTRAFWQMFSGIAMFLGLTTTACDMTTGSNVNVNPAGPRDGYLLYIYIYAQMEHFLKSIRVEL